MFEPWILFTGAYILVGIALLLFVDDVVNWYKLIFVVWPVLLAAMIINICFVIVSGIYEEIEELIIYKR